MMSKLSYLFNIRKTIPVFVIGTGRSGTHWLGFSLENHPEVRATIEKQPMFGLATSMALNPSLEEIYFDKLVRAYKRQLLISSTRYYLDKTHPNIWLADKLLSAFEDALFIGIERNPYATVASMMRHAGVSAWHKRWREFPVPNRFLGISKTNEHEYDDIPFAAQCAMRWAAHNRKLIELQASLGKSLYLISYEDFVKKPIDIVSGLSEFLCLRNYLRVPDVKVDSLDKWRRQLSEKDIADIRLVVGPSWDGR